MNRILVFGSVNVDHIYAVAHTVRPGETLSGDAVCTAWGGKGLNQAIALGKAGGSVCLAARVNAAELPALQTLCRENGVDASRVRTDPLPTGHAIIQVDAQGQNAILVAAAANGSFQPADVTAVLADFDPGDMILLQNEIDLVPEILRQAKARGLTTVLNPSPCSPAIADWPLELVDVFLLNEVEGGELTGRTAPEEILSALHARYPSARLVLTLGGDGALYRQGDTVLRQPACPAETVDTTAAGDTFTGYFLATLQRGEPPQAALALAAEAAAVTVSRRGAAQSIPTMAELLALRR